jgi:hypothetical protein
VTLRRVFVLNREVREGREEKMVFCWPGGPKNTFFVLFLAAFAILSERSKRAVKK